MNEEDASIFIAELLLLFSAIPINHASWERQIPVASSLLIYIFPLRPARPSGPTGPPAAHYGFLSFIALRIRLLTAP
jgi:hypothetical protein